MAMALQLTVYESPAGRPLVEAPGSRWMRPLGRVGLGRPPRRFEAVSGAPNPQATCKRGGQPPRRQ
jgi:hypothetical protein